jgi:hypothetical protein
VCKSVKGVDFAIGQSINFPETRVNQMETDDMLLQELGVPGTQGARTGLATQIELAGPFEEDPEDEGLADAFDDDDDDDDLDDDEVDDTDLDDDDEDDDDVDDIDAADDDDEDDDDFDDDDEDDDEGLDDDLDEDADIDPIDDGEDADL